MDLHLIRHIFAKLALLKGCNINPPVFLVFSFIIIPPFSAHANPPCWLSNLNIEHKQIYGVASTISASNLPPLHFAKANAINNWLLSEGQTEIKFDINLTTIEKYDLGGENLYFLADYQQKNKVYSLVSTNPNASNTSQACAITSCNIQQCSPSWICEDHSEQVSFISVAAPTIFTNNQIKKIIDNSQSIANTINRAKVVGVIDLLHSDTSHLTISNIQQRYSITDLSQQTNTITIGEMCTDKGTLYSQVTLNTPNIRAFHNWMDQPLLGNISGVVGYAKGQTSTGRLSDLLNVAVRRGLFEMAKTKNINVENDLKLTSNTDGYYSLMSKSHQYTESIVSAYIADMKMKINDKLQPEIFIWLLENKDKS